MIKHFLTSLFLYTAIILAVLVLLALARYLDPRGTMQVGDTKACKEIGLANC